MQVFLTIDTEVWPRTNPADTGRFDVEVSRDVFGKTPQGDFGIGYQMAVLDEFGLRGVFFVESLFADAVGGDILRRIVATIQDRGHEVQLHLHPEWLAFIDKPIVPCAGRQFLWRFSASEQRLLVDRAWENLRGAGARDVRAFRAGNFGADDRTIDALADCGIEFDTSHNRGCQAGNSRIAACGDTTQPFRMGKVWELPVACLRDGMGRLRHAQLSACGIDELCAALASAESAGWSSFVIVSHSFELIRRAARADVPARPDPIVIRRFRDLCGFLHHNRQRMPTATFADLDARSLQLAPTDAPLQASLRGTLWRYSEQLLRRCC